MKNPVDTAMALVADGRERPIAANAPTTLFSRLLKERIIFSPVRWKTRWRRSSAPSCFSSRLKTRRRKLRSTSIRTGGVVTAAWRSTIRCSYPSWRSRRSAWQPPSMGSLLLAPVLMKRECVSQPRTPASWCKAVWRLPGPGLGYRTPCRDIIKMKRRLNEVYVKHTAARSKRLKKPLIATISWMQTRRRTGA